MNEITLYEKIQDPISAAIQLGTVFAKSGMFGCTREQQGIVLAWQCFAERKTPVEIMQAYHITEDGKLLKKAMRQAAEFLARGGKEKWLSTGKDGQKAECEFTFNGQTIIESFTIDDARRQGLPVDNVKSNWRKTPANMLRARVRTNALGILCPDIVAGDTGEEEATERPGLNLTPAAPAAKLEPAIDVQSEVIQPAARVAEVSAPNQATEQPPTQSALFQAEQGDNGRLTVQTVQSLMAAIGEAHGEAALKWLEKRGWLKPLQDLGNLSVRHAQAILDKPDGFLKQVSGGQ